jgi:hypothetical protein
MVIMKRLLAFFALVMIAGAAAFAQTRESVRIYVQSSSESSMHELFFREVFRAEIEANSYTPAYRAAASDYTLNLEVTPNFILYDDGTQGQVPPNEKQFRLQFFLVRNSDNTRILSFAFPYTDPMEVDSSSSYLFYQIMMYLPYFFPEYTPPATADPPRDPPVLGDTTFIIRPGEVSPEALEQARQEVLEQARQEALEQARQEVRREEQARQAEQERLQREEQERQAALAKALEEARQEERERLLREEQERQAALAKAEREELERQAALAKALEEARQAAREEALEQARQEELARVRKLEEALKEAQAAGIREIPIPYEVEVYRDREVTKEVEVQVPGEKEVIKEPAAAEPDFWRNKMLYLRASADVPYTYFQIRPGQSLSKDEFIVVPGATVGVELHFAPFMSVELDLMARFSDLRGYTVNPGFGLQVKFPFKPTAYLMLEPYLGAAFSFNRETHSNTPYYLEAGGGFQFGFKGGQSGAWFFDANFMHTFNNVLHGLIPQVSEISTKSPELFWNRFAITLGVGYKLGFINR